MQKSEIRVNASNIKIKDVGSMEMSAYSRSKKTFGYETNHQIKQYPDHLKTIKYNDGQNSDYKPPKILTYVSPDYAEIAKKMKNKPRPCSENKHTAKQKKVVISDSQPRHNQIQNKAKPKLRSGYRSHLGTKILDFEKLKQHDIDRFSKYVFDTPEPRPTEKDRKDMYDQSNYVKVQNYKTYDDSTKPAKSTKKSKKSKKVDSRKKWIKPKHYFKLEMSSNDHKPVRQNVVKRADIIDLNTPTFSGTSGNTNMMSISESTPSANMEYAQPIMYNTPIKPFKEVKTELKAARQDSVNVSNIAQVPDSGSTPSKVQNFMFNRSEKPKPSIKYLQRIKNGYIPSKNNQDSDPVFSDPKSNYDDMSYESRSKEISYTPEKYEPGYPNRVGNDSARNHPNNEYTPSKRSDGVHNTKMFDHRQPVKPKSGFRQASQVQYDQHSQDELFEVCKGLRENVAKLLQYFTLTTKNIQLWVS